MSSERGATWVWSWEDARLADMSGGNVVAEMQGYCKWVGCRLAQNSRGIGY